MAAATDNNNNDTAPGGPVSRDGVQPSEKSDRQFPPDNSRWHPDNQGDDPLPENSCRKPGYVNDQRRANHIWRRHLGRGARSRTLRRMVCA